MNSILYLSSNVSQLRMFDSLDIRPLPGAIYSTLFIDILEGHKIVNISPAIAVKTNFNLPIGDYTFTFDALVTGMLQVKNIDDEIILSLPVDNAGKSPLVSINYGDPVQMQVNNDFSISNTPEEPAKTPTDAPSITDFSLDGRGSFTEPFSIDAGTGAFNFTDSFAQPNKVIITNFGADDQITLQGVDAAMLNNGGISSTSDDVSILMNNNGVVSQIDLIGVANNNLIYDIASFNALNLGDIVIA